jgi:ABC-type transport system involved in cytochrome c biogenesis permease subunit
MKQTPNRLRNFAFAAAAAQAGCSSVIVVFGALFAGLWLDTHFGTKPTFTLGLIVLSVPVSLIVMFALVLGATRNISQPDPPESEKEDRP